jgi:hypothetical protein
MSNDSAVRAKLRDMLAETLAKVTLPLFTAQGTVAFNFSDATENLTDILFRFWQANQRMPELIFNDGIPPSWKAALESRPMSGLNSVMSPLVWTTFTPSGDGSETVNTQSLLLFNCKYNPKPGVVVKYREDIITANGDIEQFYTDAITYPLNSRVVYQTPRGTNVYVNVPRSDFVAGAFQTWGVLLVVLTHPQYVYATDDGLMLSPDGIGMIERSAAHWLARGLRGGAAWWGSDAVIADKLGAGPVMVGIPQALIDKMQQFENQLRADDNFVRTLATWVFTFVGFYFGASAASGLIGGAFSIPNLSGTLQLVSRLGFDTGDASSALKIVGALTGPGNLWQSPVQSGVSMDDFSGDWGIDPTTIEYSTADLTESFEGVPFDFIGALSNDEFYAILDIDPVDIEYGAADAFANLTGDYGPPPEGYDSAAILAEQNSMLEYYMQGTVSPAQYVATVAASPAASAAVQTAIRAAGGNPSNPQTSPQQIVQARQVAQQQAQMQPGNNAWEIAANALTLYERYQRAQSPTQASAVRYPSTQTGIVRQPDGSISIPRADGTVTTIRPNGQTATTGTMAQLKNFVADNSLLIAGAAGVLIVGAIVLSRRR